MLARLGLRHEGGGGGRGCPAERTTQAQPSGCASKSGALLANGKVAGREAAPLSGVGSGGRDARRTLLSFCCSCTSANLVIFVGSLSQILPTACNRRSQTEYCPPTASRAVMYSSGSSVL